MADIHLAIQKSDKNHTLATQKPYAIIPNMEEHKIKKSFRFSPEIVRQLQEIASKLNTNETEAVGRAISHYYLVLKGEEEAVVRGGLVPLSVYQSTQEKLERLIYKLGELEGALKEKEEVLKAKEEALRAKEELIEELRRKIEERRPWWRRWLKGEGFVP